MRDSGDAVVETATLSGTRAVRVEVQADVGAGLPAFHIVGLGDTAVMEARERVRSAIKSSGFRFPGARVVINLAPGPLRKHGTGFDLPIAVALLVATGQLPGSVTENSVFAGELALDGAVRSVPGVLAHAVAAAAREARFVCSRSCLHDVAVVPGLICSPVETLADLSSSSQAREHPSPPCDVSLAPTPVTHLSEVAGHQHAKRALVIAAAGAHNLLFVGPPGSGKTMLARCLPGLLPVLTGEERLEAALVHSVAGLDTSSCLAGVRPFRAPHHSCSVAGLVGGGSPPRPGETSLAHTGVLFLDELPEFGPGTLQSLRQPLEDGRVTLVRADGRITYPARFALVAAANPCPCGYADDARGRCVCTPNMIDRYMARIGGPLMDRIDIHMRIANIDPERLIEPGNRGNDPDYRGIVLQARRQALERDGQPPAALSGARLHESCALSTPARAMLLQFSRTTALSGRGITRLLRVARTCADLEGSERVDGEHVQEAISLRSLGGE